MSVARQYRAKLASVVAGAAAGRAAAGRRVSRAAAGRRAGRAVAGRRAGRAAAATLAGGLLLASCTVSSDQPVFKRVGPLITLRVGVFGDPGYQRAGLYTQYERLHPNIKIIQTDATDQASYWSTLQARLKSGHGLDDIQAVPMADISAVTGPLATDFVPLNTLGGVSGGNSAFTDDWLPWVAQQAAGRAGISYALGAEIGPIAACYRTTLLREAGLPTSPTVLAKDWSSWAGYLRFGRLFHARIPHGRPSPTPRPACTTQWRRRPRSSTTARPAAWPWPPTRPSNRPGTPPCRRPATG